MVISYILIRCSKVLLIKKSLFARVAIIPVIISFCGIIALHDTIF